MQRQMNALDDFDSFRHRSASMTGVTEENGTAIYTTYIYIQSEEPAISALDINKRSAVETASTLYMDQARYSMTLRAWQRDDLEITSHSTSSSLRPNF